MGLAERKLDDLLAMLRLNLLNWMANGELTLEHGVEITVTQDGYVDCGSAWAHRQHVEVKRMPRYDAGLTHDNR